MVATWFDWEKGEPKQVKQSGYLSSSFTFKLSIQPILLQCWTSDYAKRLLLVAGIHLFYWDTVWTSVHLVYLRHHFWLMWLCSKHKLIFYFHGFLLYSLVFLLWKVLSLLNPARQVQWNPKCHSSCLSCVTKTSLGGEVFPTVGIQTQFSKCRVMWYSG